MRVVQVNYAYDEALASSAELLNRYTTLTGWAAAVARAGAEVLTVQQFHTSSNVTRAGQPYVFGVFDEIAQAARDFRPDVVHVNGLGFPLRTWVLRRWLPSTPIVVQDHASAAPRSAEASRSIGGRSSDGARAFRRATGRAFSRAIKRQLMSVVDAFLFASTEQAEPWRRVGLIRPRQRVYEVPEASTDVRRLPCDEARAASGVTGNPAVLWVGRLNENKDPLTVLDGFERFAARRPAATLTMVFHETDLIDAVRGRVGVSGVLRDRVRLAGEVPHDRIAAFFSAADVFVLGSHHEGSGYSLIEAIACGAAPAVTDIPSFRAMAGDIGARWPTGNAEACARAIEHATTIPRERVIDHFNANLTWDAVGRRAVTIYKDVITNMANG